MKRLLRRILALVGILSVIQGLCDAATYHTTTSGDDTASGAESAPFRTIKKGVDQLQAGDTLVVHSGVYDERITTVRGGTSKVSRITIRADGEVGMKGWIVNHPFITIRGFRITGHSGATVVDAHVIANRNGNFLELLECTIGETAQRVLPRVRFDATTTNIVSLDGGFAELGLKPGMTVFCGPGADSPRLGAPNFASHRILGATDDTLVVSNRLGDQGPLPVFVAASYIYGVYLTANSRGAVISHCRFVNLGYDALFILGSNHVIENNQIERLNGWDVMHFGGSNHLFRRNHIRNSPIVLYQISPDSMENYSPNPYTNVTFKENFFQNFSGVIAAQKGGGTSSRLLVLRNVYVDLEGPFLLSHGGTEIRNNSFLRVGRTNNPVVSVSRHVIVTTVVTNPVAGSPAASNTVVLNNLFLDCGQPNGNLDREDVGWYEVVGNADTFRAAGNYAAGAGPAFKSKRNWPEAPELTGGDPDLLDIGTPLGPDQIPFTDDDGLRPRDTSKLVGAGVGGATIGAYEVHRPSRPTLKIAQLTETSIQLSWPVAAADWTLETSASASGPWYGAPGIPTQGAADATLTLERTPGPGFYRLVE